MQSSTGMPRCCLEVACFSGPSAIIAAKAGADRIELCDNAQVGGTTPSNDTLVKVRDAIAQPIFVMIRPRGGDFVYSEEELAEMKRDIARFKHLADGFVFGILTRSGEVNEHESATLVRLADPLPCTMHRAFDETSNLSDALSKAIDCGFKTVLTSGGASDALTGVESLARLVQQSDDKIEVMPGGNVRSKNLFELRQKAGAQWYHSSARGECDANLPDETEIQSMKAILR